MPTLHLRLRGGLALSLLPILALAFVGRADESEDTIGAAAMRSDSDLGQILTVTVRTRSDDGFVFCALWASADGYPVDQTRAAHSGSAQELEGHRAQIRFDGVSMGPYALACFHDENGNETLDTHLIGIPSEGTGASNAAQGFMGPPSFSDARFLVSEKGPDALSIRIDY